MKNKSIYISVVLMLLFSLLSYSVAKKTSPAYIKKMRNKSVQLIDAIADSYKAGKSPLAQQLTELRKLSPYIPKKYKRDIVKRAFATVPGLEIVKVKPTVPGLEIVKVKPTLERTIFKIVFNKRVDQFINDIKIEKDKIGKYRNFLLQDVVAKIMKGAKLYPGPDTGKILSEQKKQERQKNRPLTGAEIQAIADKFYTKEKRAQLAKMARNMLANEITEKYLEEDLKGKDNQLSYRTKLIKAFTPQAKHKTEGYNIQKIEFLMTIKKPLTKRAIAKKLAEKKAKIEKELKKLRKIIATKKYQEGEKPRISAQEKQMKKELAELIEKQELEALKEKLEEEKDPKERAKIQSQFEELKKLRSWIYKNKLKAGLDKAIGREFDRKIKRVMVLRKELGLKDK